MIQDYLYLIDYTKVFSIGAAKSTDLAFMRLFAGYTHSILDGEMDIHRAYMERLGITREEAEQTPVALDNLLILLICFASLMRGRAGGGSSDIVLRPQL